MCLRDRGVVQGQGVVRGVIDRLAAAALHGVVRRFQDVLAVHPQLLHLGFEHGVLELRLLLAARLTALRHHFR